MIEDRREEARMYLVTVAIKAWVVLGDRREAMRALRRRAALAVLGRRRACVALQRVWRAAALRRLETRGRAALERVSRRLVGLTRLTALARGLLTRLRVAAECSKLERELVVGLLRAWKEAATPLTDRAATWSAIFQGRTAFARLYRARHLVQNEPPKRLAARRDAAERKLAYARLKAGTVDLPTHLEAFGLSHVTRRRKRRLIGALFSEPATASPSADLVDALGLRRGLPEDDDDGNNKGDALLLRRPIALTLNLTLWIDTASLEKPSC